MNRYDAIVIGGGPAGATAAMLLARAGWAVAVVERDAYPRGKVCGEYISAATLALLHDLGIEAVVSSAGPEVRRVAVCAKTVCASAGMPAYPHQHEAYGRALGREECDARLLQHAVAAGAALWQPFRATSLRGTAGAFECDVEAPGARHTLRARCVIAAHGSWEPGGLPTQVRRAAARPGDLFGFKAHFHSVRLAPDLLPLMFFPGGYAGLVHTSGARVTFSCCIRRDALAATRARYPGLAAGEALLAYAQAENRGAQLAMATAERVDPWLACGPLRPGIRRGLPPGVYAVGNAAGEAHPLVGEGISMAIQSAVLLCARLRRAVASNAWAEAGALYEREWRGLFASRLRMSACYAQLAMRPALSAAATLLLSGAPRLLTLGARWSGKMSGYPQASGERRWAQSE